MSSEIYIIRNGVRVILMDDLLHALVHHQNSKINVRLLTGSTEHREDLQLDNNIFTDILYMYNT